MATSMEEFNAALLHSLEKLKVDYSLKTEQRKAVLQLYEGRDVFVLLPTGYGKSICYQVLPFLFDWKLHCSSAASLVVVVSPLISLMVDQVQELRQKGISAAILSSDTHKLHRSLLAAEDELASYSHLYCSPEAVVGEKWHEICTRPSISQRLIAIAIDEAHCVSKWSKDFRPHYGRLDELRSLAPRGTPFLACTATATKAVRAQVTKMLGMQGCVYVSASPDRPNIFYGVKPASSIEEDFNNVVESIRSSRLSAPRVLIYCRSRSACADLFSHFLSTLGSASYYPNGADHLSSNRLFAMFHGGTLPRLKDFVLGSLGDPNGVVRVVFATVALGMGVDLRSVNSIVHYGAPRTIEDYFQESGRGGRSGECATSVVYWKPSEVPLRRDQTVESIRDKENKFVRQYLVNVSECRRLWLMRYFEHSISCTQDPLLCCDICSSRETLKLLPHFNS